MSDEHAETAVREGTAGDGISVKTETLPGSRVGLTIEVPTPQVDAAYQRVMNRLAQRVKVQGFRPGKAPRALIEAKVGAEGLREEVAEALIPNLVNQAVRDQGLDVIDRPQVEIQELERGKPATFVARVSVVPEVTLPDLDTLHVDPPHTEVDDAAVQRRLDTLLDRLAEVEPVEREVRQGDVVVGDLKVFADGEEVPSEARNAIELEVRENVLVPGLLEALPGKQVGEVAQAEVDMPDDHSNEALQGKQAQLQVTVQGVKEKRVPELTDEVAKELSQGEQDTAEGLREGVRRDLVEQAQRSDRLQLEQKAVQALVEAAEVEVPDPLVDHEVDHQLEDLKRQLEGQGLRLDRYFEYLGRSEAAYRAELRPQAADRVKVDLVLEQLQKQMQLEPSDDEVRDYIRQQAESDSELKENLDQLLENDSSLGFFRHRLTRLRIVEALAQRLGGGAGVTGEPVGGGDDVERMEVEVETAPADTSEDK